MYIYIFLKKDMVIVMRLNILIFISTGFFFCNYMKLFNTHYFLIVN